MYLDISSSTYPQISCSYLVKMIRYFRCGPWRKFPQMTKFPFWCMIVVCLSHATARERLERSSVEIVDVDDDNGPSSLTQIQSVPSVHSVGNVVPSAPPGSHSPPGYGEFDSYPVINPRLHAFEDAPINGHHQIRDDNPQPSYIPPTVDDIPDVSVQLTITHNHYIPPRHCRGKHSTDNNSQASIPPSPVGDIPGVSINPESLYNPPQTDSTCISKVTR